MTGLDFDVLVNASAILFGVFGLVVVYLARGVDRWPLALSVATLSSAVLRSVLELINYAVAYADVPPALRLVLRNAELVVGPLPALLMFAYFLSCCGEDYKKSLVLRLRTLLSCALVTTMLLAQLTGEFNGVSNEPIRFGLWLALIIPLDFAILVTCIVALCRRWNKLTRLQRVLFSIMFALSFFSTNPMAIVFMELLLLSDLVRRYLAQQEEAARQQARIAVLQMRPHFIHNALTSIYYLCAKDSDKAQRAILNFSRYLENNFTAIVEEQTIPFSKELEHTKAYLAVEQVCHEGHLLVEFKTPVTFFRIPPLTLQPLVENAVKHGMDADAEPLRVLVSTRDTESGVAVTVEDNGPGYAPPEDGEGHGFALGNIRERLKAQCDGTLEITTRDEGGTRAVIFIPHKE